MKARVKGRMTSSNDARLARFRARLKVLDGARITAGIHAAEGWRKTGRGPSVLEYMTSHEFGLQEPRVPQRSWLSGWFDAHHAKILKLQRKAVLAVVKGADPVKVLEQWALWIEGDLKRRIRSRRAFKKNAQSTIDRKGSSTPLIDTGLGWASIKAKVSHDGR